VLSLGANNQIKINAPRKTKKILELLEVHYVSNIIQMFLLQPVSSDEFRNYDALSTDLL